MAIEYTKSGSATAADLNLFQVERLESGDLKGRVVFNVLVNGKVDTKMVEWILSAAEKTAIANSLLPGLLATIDAAT